MRKSFKSMLVLLTVLAFAMSFMSCDDGSGSDDGTVASAATVFDFDDLAVGDDFSTSATGSDDWTVSGSAFVTDNHGSLGDNSLVLTGAASAYTTFDAATTGEISFQALVDNGDTLSVELVGGYATDGSDDFITLDLTGSGAFVEVTYNGDTGSVHGATTTIISGLDGGEFYKYTVSWEDASTFSVAIDDVTEALVVIDDTENGTDFSANTPVAIVFKVDAASGEAYIDDVTSTLF